MDNLDEWIERMQSKPYKKVAIFVDNSGADIVLGVIPFARELLKQNTKVRKPYETTVLIMVSHK